jgi:hypothetical protein
MANVRSLALASVIALIACSSSDGDVKPSVTARPEITPPRWNADCDPLVPYHCGFPFPSNTALKDDPSTPTKKRVAFKSTVLPEWKGKPTSAETYNDFDGFSPSATILTLLPYATTTGLANEDSLAKSISKDSPTIVLDLARGELVPHIAELDRSARNPDDQAFMIRPVVRLRDATRYVVAIRRVVDPDGVAIPPSPAFAALRDGKPSNEPSIEARRGLYTELFAALEKAGIPKNDLQLAWDFTTASKDNITRSLVHMRDEALKTVGADGPEYVIDKVEENPNEYIRKRIKGRFTVPLYTEKKDAPTKLVRGTDGLPKQNGTAEFEFLVHVPKIAETKPCPLLQNGHGLLGYKTEGQDGYLAEMAEKGCFVAFSVDLVGMAHEDASVLTDQIIGDIGDFRTTIDRQHQGLLNELLAMRMMKGRFVREPEIQFGGHSAIDPSAGYWRGDSQGGIFGASYMALSTDVTRGVLGEPGAPYSILLNRSLDFTPFFFLLGGTYADGYDMQLALGLAQMMWDRTEPGGYVRYINEDPHDLVRVLPEAQKQEAKFLKAGVIDHFCDGKCDPK